MPLALIALGLPLAGCGDLVRVRVESPEGEERFEVCAEEATTAEERRTGLAARDPLGDDEGLLLRFPVEGEVCIDNRGVSFAIDAVFADARGVVQAVERDIPAGDANPHCELGVKTVLELRAGRVHRAQSGDRLQTH